MEDNPARKRQVQSKNISAPRPDYSYLEWLYKKIETKEFNHLEAVTRLIKAGFEHAHGGVDWERWNECIRNHGWGDEQSLEPLHKNREATKDDPVTEKESRKKTLYTLNSCGLFLSQWLANLAIADRLKAIESIVRLHKELDEKLIGELIDDQGNSLLESLKISTAEQVAEFLAQKEITSFFLDPQELLFTSKERAEEISLKLREIYCQLGLITRVSGREYLNLEAINPRESKETDYKCEMEELIEAYYSFFPRCTGKVYL